MKGVQIYGIIMFRTFGVIIVSFIVLIMYVLHRKKNGKFIKRKAVNEEEKIKYQKWEKIINVMAVVGLLILGIFITVPCCLDIPYLLSNNLVELPEKLHKVQCQEKTLIVKEEYILEMRKLEKNIH